MNENLFPGCDEEEIIPVDPIEARATLVQRVELIQRNLAGIVILKDNDVRRKRIDPLREEIEFIKSQVNELDTIIAYTPASIPPTSHSHHKSSGSSSARVVDQSKLQNNVNTFSSPDFKLPSNLPSFSSGKDADDFIDSLTNLLLAHNVDESRWSSALLVCCCSSSDAAWVRDNLLQLPWRTASQRFLDRFRDPLQLHRLQAEFYTLKKHFHESMLVFSTRFERFVHRLRLEGPCLIPQFISCLPQVMATQLQLYSITRNRAFAV